MVVKDNVQRHRIEVAQLNTSSYRHNYVQSLRAWVLKPDVEVLLFTDHVASWQGG